jgi:hypothetical protein
MLSDVIRQVSCPEAGDVNVFALFFNTNNREDIKNIPYIFNGDVI